MADPEVADNRVMPAPASTVLLGLPANVVLQRINDAPPAPRACAWWGRTWPARRGLHRRACRRFPPASLGGGALPARVSLRGAGGPCVGYTGSPSAARLEEKIEGRDILAIDVVGNAGVEATYDAYLSGEHGESQVMVDANGRRISVASDIKDTKGNDLYLTIDARAQYVADAAPGQASSRHRAASSARARAPRAPLWHLM